MLEHSRMPVGMIDHKCQNPTCVRPKHLREATRKENGENQSPLRANNKSGYRGVHWDKAYGKWIASVRHNGKLHNLGGYNTPLEAAEVAKTKRNELFTHNESDRQ